MAPPRGTAGRGDRELWVGAAGVAVTAVAAMLIPAALGPSSEAVVKGALEEAEQRVAEPDLVG